eukprot:scaffold51401_cov36-Tisochrysis_lutea.AAC.1
MVTYQSLNGTSESGVISLAIVREVKPVVSGGILRSQTPVPMQWMIVADDETLKLEAPTESVKEQWMTTIADLAKRQIQGYTPTARLVSTTFQPTPPLLLTSLRSTSFPSPLSLPLPIHYDNAKFNIDYVVRRMIERFTTLCKAQSGITHYTATATARTPPEARRLAFI